MRKQGVWKKQDGFSVLDILIGILIIAVIAAIFIPQRKQAINEMYRDQSRFKMVVMSEAMEQYYKTAGGQIDLGPIEEEDTLVLADSIAVETEATEEEDTTTQVMPRRFYTENFDEIKGFLPEKEWVEEKAKLMNFQIEDITKFYPENFDIKSYPNIKDIKIFAKDSSYYVINDPNGHGTVLNGKLLWDEN